MNQIRITFDIGPFEGNKEITGSYIFQSNNPNEAFIINALKKSIARLKIEKEKIIIGLFDVFINDKPTYQVGLFGTSRIIKTDIRKL